MAFNIADFNNKWANFKEELKDYFNKRVVDKNGDTMIGRLILSKDPSEDMEAVTKQFVENMIKQHAEFSPGTLRYINFGVANVPFATVYSTYTTPDIPLDTLCTIEGETQNIALSQGKALLECTIPKLDIYSYYYTDGRAYYYASRIVMSAKITANDVVLIDEQNCEVITGLDRYSSTNRLNPNSIFSTSKKISEIEIPIYTNQPIIFKVEMSVHSYSPYSNTYPHSINLDNFSVLSTKVGVSNPLVESTTIYY